MLIKKVIIKKKDSLSYYQTPSHSHLIQLNDSIRWHSPIPVLLTPRQLPLEKAPNSWSVSECVMGANIILTSYCNRNRCILFLRQPDQAEHGCAGFLQCKWGGWNFCSRFGHFPQPNRLDCVLLQGGWCKKGSSVQVWYERAEVL